MAPDGEEATFYKMTPRRNPLIKMAPRKAGCSFFIVVSKLVKKWQKHQQKSGRPECLNSKVALLNAVLSAGASADICATLTFAEFVSANLPTMV